MADTQPNTCPDCNNGLQNGRICTTCYGRSTIPVRDWERRKIREYLTRFDELESKLDAILAEQASQREDLTNTLTQIWNKVKDL